MGLANVFVRTAVRATRVLVVEVPGQWSFRVGLERQMLDKGWRAARTPAEADVLAVCGTPGPELTPLVSRLWDQLPGPRVRVDITTWEDLDTALNDAENFLLDTAHQAHDAATRSHTPGLEHASHGDHGGGDEHGDHEATGYAKHGGNGEDSTTEEDMNHAGHGDHGGDENASHGGHGDPRGHGDHDHETTDHDGNGHHDHHVAMDHTGHGDHEGHDTEDHQGHGGRGGHGGHDHGGMDMSPAGIALAEGGEDRDGLEMDVLHLPLGPVLPFWPAGLVVTCSLQGDVLVDADAKMIDSSDGEILVGAGDRASPGAVWCDHAMALLALAGAEDAAAAARITRDAAVNHDWDRARTSVTRLHRRVRRSVLVRWAFRGVLPLAVSDLEAHGLPDHFLGDAYDRLLMLIEQAAGEIDGQEPGAGNPLSLTSLSDLVVGLEVATARLAVASLAVTPAPSAGGAGHE